MSEAWKYNQRIASDPNLCAPIIEQLLEQLKRFDWSDKDSFAVHMAMEEAIINGIKHGNECKPGTSVLVQMSLDAQRFEATVTDEGQGFDPENVDDPTADENLDRCCGRGVMLIRHFVDEVEYNAQGNSVKLTKRKSQ